MKSPALAVLSLLAVAILTTHFTFAACAAKNSSTTSNPASPAPLNGGFVDSNVGGVIDFSSHPDFHLLPSLSECGFQYVLDSEPSPLSNSGHRPHRVKRIVGGAPTEIGAHPWMVQLLLRNLTTDTYRPICGGTIINNRTVLTAAHCVTDLPADGALTRVTLGSYRNHDQDGSPRLSPVHARRCDLDEEGERLCWTTHLSKIEAVIVHEDYVTGDASRDVALLRLRDSIYRLNTSVESWSTNVTARRIFQSRTFVRPICLPRRPDILAGLKHASARGLGKFMFVGWGRMSGPPKYVEAPYLTEVKLTLVPSALCSPFMEERAQSSEAESSRPDGPEQELCVLGAPGTGTCFGDSGSPLLKSFPVPELGGKPQIFQVGLDSKSAFAQGGCAVDGVPDSFTNVVAHMPWILDHLTDD